MNDKPSTTASQPFVKRVPFEPEPGQLGMNLDQMIEAGLIQESDVTTQAGYDSVLGLMKLLKDRRESLSLSLTDVSERSGLTRQVLSKLENGHTTNPTVATLARYAMALGSEVTLGLKDLEGNE